MIEIRIERYRFRIDPLHGLRVAVGKRGDRSSWAGAIGCLLSLYPLHLGAVEVATPPATPAPKESATDQTTSWEEPSLFPQEGTGGVAPTPVFPNERSHRESDVNKIEPPPIETDNATMARATAAFQAEFSNANSNYSNLAGIGLESTKERDAILARIQRDATNQPYNIKLGRIPLQMGASLIVDFSDNIGASSANKEADLTVIPRLEISGAVKLGSRTTLSLGLGIGYIKYFARSENDRFLMSASLAPDSGISLDIKMGKFLISVFDKPTLPQFQTDALTQRDQIQYNQFTNTAGITVLWNINSRTNMSFRYDHSNSFAISSDGNTPDASTDSFMASLACQLTDSLGVGVEASTQSVKYDSDFLNDGTTFNVGPFVNYRISSYTQLQASFGYQGGEYENTGGIEDQSSLGTYYTNVSISNSLNSHLTHSLSLGRQSQRGSFSNFAVSNYIRYQMNWDLVKNVRLGGSVSFSDVEESGGIFSEHFRTYSFGLFCGFKLNQHISINMLYVYTNRYLADQSTSQGDLLNFTENRISLRLDYTF